MRYFCCSFLMLLVFACTAELKAQACADDLQASNEHYAVGRFDAAIASATRCILKSDATQTEQRDTFRLLALINIAKDDSRQAREAVQRLLDIDPDYAPNPVEDPPTFVQLVEALRATESGDPPPNQPPVVARQPAPISILAGADAVTQDLTPVFSDPEGQALSFAATSIRPEVASATVDGSQVRVTPGDTPGQVDVVLTATDAGGATVEARLSVAVQALPSVAVVQPIGGVVLTLGGAVFERALTDVFEASDQAVLTFSAASGAPDVATVTLLGTALQVIPQAVGEAEVTLTATHGLGAVGTHRFAVTVTPQPAVQVVTALNPLTLVTGDPAYTRDLAADPAVFSDARGGALTYAATSSAPGIATAQVTGTVLRVAPVAGGQAEVSVTAQNEAGLRARLTFTTTVNTPPALVLKDPAQREDPPEQGPQVKPPAGGGSGALKWILIGGGLAAGGVAGLLLAGGGGNGGTPPPGGGTPIADPPALPSGN